MGTSITDAAVAAVEISDTLERACPALARRLRGLGIDVRSGVSGTAPWTLLAPDDPAVVARAVRVASGGASSWRAGPGWLITAAAEDESFAAALIAALVRPARAPVACSPAAADVFALAERVAASRASVLVEGPTGVGKEVIARLLHDRSPRADGPFVAVNCAALPEHLVEALLFGHDKGAFTGASASAKGYLRAADGGTLFLDEVGELPLHQQAKLLRALQEREVVPVGASASVPVDIRVVAATNRCLATEVDAGRFREDLYYRLNVVPLSVPALRARPEDIVPLAATLLVRHFRDVDARPWLGADACAKLVGHDWPGNVRELENVLLRAQALAADDRIGAGHIQFARRKSADQPTTLGNVVKLHEYEAIRAVLRETRGRRQAAAERLGISERTLRYRLAEMSRHEGAGSLQ
jgi:two-component system response regulator FlrC